MVCNLSKIGMALLVLPCLFGPGANTAGAETMSLNLLGEPWSDERPVSALRGVPIDTGGYQYGDPTAAEQAHLELINRARLNPQAEANRLLGGNINEGIDLAHQISLIPKQPLTFNAKLYQAARLHSQDMVARDYFAHNSPENITPWQRITTAGYNYITAAENIYLSVASYPLNEVNTIVGMHDGFVIDAGVTGRGHRINIFNPALKEIGVGSAQGNFLYQGTNWPYAWTLTCDYGTRTGNSFILGVVYDDKNLNGAYTAGEGVGGVTIAVVQATNEDTASTVSASAGGYGIPLPAASYTITATLANGRTSVRQVVLGTQNIKVDFKVADFILPGGCDAPGDVDGDGYVDLKDAVLALQILTGRTTSVTPCIEASVKDGKIGLPETFYILRTSAAQ